MLIEESCGALNGDNFSRWAKYVREHFHTYKKYNSLQGTTVFGRIIAHVMDTYDNHRTCPDGHKDMIETLEYWFDRPSMGLASTLRNNHINPELVKSEIMDEILSYYVTENDIEFY